MYTLHEKAKKGVDYFNGRRFFKALLPFEDAFFASGNEERIFYQGLVQLTAAMLKITRWPKKPAALSLLKKSLEKFKKVDHENFGLDVLSLIEDIKKLSEGISLMEDGNLAQIAPENLPSLRPHSG